jgi:adenylate cyclase
VTIGVTRIGINSGPALVGNFGGGRFFDYAAYGDTLSVAARLETANKQLGTRICVSDSVVQRIAGFRGRPVGCVTLRGRKEALIAHEPLPPERHSDPLTCEYLAAYAKSEAGDPSALSAFAALLGRDSNDGLVSFHLKRLLAGATGMAITLE